MNVSWSIGATMFKRKIGLCDAKHVIFGTPIFLNKFSIQSPTSSKMTMHKLPQRFISFVKQKVLRFFQTNRQLRLSRLLCICHISERRFMYVHCTATTIFERKEWDCSIQLVRIVRINVSSNNFIFHLFFCGLYFVVYWIRAVNIQSCTSWKREKWVPIVGSKSSGHLL